MCKMPKIVPIRPRGSSNVYPMVQACGDCSECRAAARSEFALRCYSEEVHSKSSFFITLTYTDENLPFYGLSRCDRRHELDALSECTPYFDMYGKFVLNKEHATKFFYSLHDLVKKYDSTMLARFVINGEYSPFSHRPHMHCLCWLPFYLDKSDMFEMMSRLWMRGNYSVGDVTPASINYLGKHAMKEDCGNDYLQQKVSPIFQKRCVKNGGIGRYLYKDDTLLANYYNGSNSTVYGKYLVNIPRYTKKKLHPDTYSESEIAEMSRQSLQNVADRLFSEFGITPDLVQDNLIRIYRDGCGRSDCCSEFAQTNPLMSNVVNLYRSYNYDSNISDLGDYFKKKFNQSVLNLSQIGYFTKNRQKDVCD